MNVSRDVPRFVASLSEGPPPMLLVSQVNPGEDANAVMLCDNTSPHFVLASDYDTIRNALIGLYRWTVQEQTIGGGFTRARNAAILDAEEALNYPLTPMLTR